jgi:gliding motility-associated-like protein
MDQYLSNSSWTNSKNEWRSFNNAPGVAIGLDDTSGSPVITLTFNVAPFKQLNITGYNFWRQRSNSGPQNWIMRINGTQVDTGSTPTGGNATGDITLSSPANNLTGTVTLTLALTNGGSNSATFRLDDFILYGTVTSTCTQPVISSVVPLTGPANTQVTLTGTGFTGASAVMVNGVAATYNVVSATEIKVTVPENSTNGPITVTTNSCQSDPSAAFTYTTGVCAPVTGLTELFISEVFDDQVGEGGVIEIYNPTTNVVDMSQYAIDHYIDWGNTTPVSTNPLTGMLPPGGIYLVKRTQNLLTCNPSTIYTSGLNEGFNDNDKLDLTKNGIVIDRVRTPNNTGFSMLRLATATPLPSATYIPAQWNIDNNESCADVGLYSMPGTPQASITTQPQNTAICGGNAATFTVAISGGTGFTYQWKTLDASGNWVNVTNDATFSGAQTATLTINGTTSLNNSQYYVQVTSPTCTLISNAALLLVGSGPATPVFTVSPLTCVITTATITVTPVAGLQYSIDGTAYNTTGIFTGVSAGNITLYVKDASGCITTTPITISPSATIPVVPAYTATALSCTVTSATVTFDPTASTGLEFSTDGTNFSTSNVISGLASGSHTITVRNAGGCTNTVVINIAPSAVAPVVPAYTATALSCTVTTATVTFDPTASTGLEFSTDGTNFSASNVIAGLTSGNHTITVRNAGGCTNSVVVNIAPSAVPPAVPTYTATVINCINTTATISVDPIAGLEYSIDGTNFSSNNVFTGLISGNYTITVRNAGNCTNSVQVNIASAPLPPSFDTFEGCTQTTSGRHFIFEITSEGNFDFSSLDYEWKNTAGTVVSTDGPEFDVTQYAASNNINAFPIRLTLTTTTAEGCTQVFNFEAAGTACDIPRGISPNGDNRNDEFDLSGMNVQQLTIFNRYGLEVYSRANYVKEWFGQTDKGDDLPTGTYFYVVKTAAGSKTGWVYINRQQ